MSVSNISFLYDFVFVGLPSIVCEDSARLFSMYIINFKYIIKIERTVGNNKYINYPIVYTVTHAKGVSRCVSECKLGSVSEHILKERLKRDGKNNEQNAEPTSND